MISEHSTHSNPTAGWISHLALPLAINVCCHCGYEMVWNVEKVREYQHYLSTGSCVKLNEILSIIGRQTGDDLTPSVNDAVVAFTDGIRLAADPLFLKRFNIVEGAVNCSNDKKNLNGQRMHGDLVKRHFSVCGIRINLVLRHIIVSVW